MPIIKIDKKILEKTAGRKLDEKFLSEKISMMGVSLEKIEGNKLEIEISPNRPDMLSTQGFSRAFSNFIGAEKKVRKYFAKKSDYKVLVEKSVSEVRPYTACAVIKNVSLDEEKVEELISIQEKLHITFGRNRKKVAIGIYPMEKIKFPIRYLAKKPKDIKFMPLDYSKEMDGLEILESHEKGKEFKKLLEGKKEFPIFIDANNEILSMPPIINSERTGKIDYSTKNLFIECSGFDLEYLKKGLNIIVCAIADMGGEINSVEVVYPDKKFVLPELESRKIKLNLKYCSRILGKEFSENEAGEALLKMGIDYEKGVAFIPCYRNDIMHQVDLAEEIAIGYGYNNFEPRTTESFNIGAESKVSEFKNALREMICNLGFLEANTYNIISNEKQTKMMNCELPTVKIFNPLSEEHDSLRFWTTPSVIDVLKNNRNKEYPQRIFSMGRNFHYGKNETGIGETERVSAVMAGKDADYTKIRQVLDYILKMLGLKGEYSEVQHFSFIPGRTARVSCKGKNIAYIGEISPVVLNNWCLEVPVACLELNILDLLDVMK